MSAGKVICCKTCRWWDMHSIDMKMGDCKSPDGLPGHGVHRYWRGTLGDGSAYYLLDSFGPQETKPDHSCGAWSRGQVDGLLSVSAHPNNGSRL